MKTIYVLLLAAAIFLLAKTIQHKTVNAQQADKNVEILNEVKENNSQVIGPLENNTINSDKFQDLAHNTTLDKTENSGNVSEKEHNADKYSPSAIWDLNYVREIRLNFTSSSWKNMQPYGGFFGVDGKPGGWHLGNIVYPTLIKDGDSNFDAIMSYEEFLNLGEKWFDSWNTKNDNELNYDMLVAGFSNTFQISLQGVEGNGVAKMIGVKTPTVAADFLFEDVVFDSISLRYKGNGTLLETVQSNKKSIKIDLNDGFPGRKLAGATKLNFHNLSADPGYVNDVIAYQLYKEAGVPAPRTSYAKMYFEVPDTLENEYLGLYLMVEQVDDNFAKHWFGNKKGELLKPGTNNLFEYLGEDWNLRYEKSFDPKTKLSLLEKRYIVELCKFVSQTNDEEFSEKLGVYFDLDNFARYLAVTAFISEIDGILGPRLQNFYLYIHPETFQLSILPWDLDHSLGNAWQKLSVEQVVQLSIEKPWLGKNFFLERLFKVEEFNSLYYSYLNEFCNTIFKPERLLSQINELAEYIRPAIAMESEEKLNKFDFIVGWNNIEDDPNDSANLVYPVPIRAFIEPRYESVVSQLAGKNQGIKVEKTQLLDDAWYGARILKLADSDKDSIVTKQEMLSRFDSLYTAWGGSTTELIPEFDFRENLNTLFMGE